MAASHVLRSGGRSEAPPADGRRPGMLRYVATGESTWTPDFFLINRAGNATIEELFARSGTAPVAFVVSLAEMLRRGLIRLSSESEAGGREVEGIEAQFAEIAKSVQSAQPENAAAVENLVSGNKIAANTHVMATTKGLRSVL